MLGAVLSWEQGQWYLDQSGRRTAVFLLPTSLRHPLFIYVELKEMHTRKLWRLWIFSDSADPEQLRKLRTRLTLDKS